MQINSKLKNSEIYISSAWQQHADLITHLCHFSQNILLVLGQEQSGKSAFSEHFLTAPGAGLKVCSFKADPENTVEDLLKVVATGFELNWENAASTTLEVKTQAIAAYQKAHETWMLMIDDAHLLDDIQLAALLQLVQFNDEARHQLHLVLVGESSLEARLFSPTLAMYAEGKVYSIELEPWTLHDVKRYLARERVAMHLSPEEIGAMFERTQGLPGRVILERQLLQDPLTEGAITMTKQHAKRWTHPIALGAVAGFLLGGSYLLFNNTQDEEVITAPINAAQVENYRLDNSDEKVAMEEEPAPELKQAETMSPTATTAVIATTTTAVTPTTAAVSATTVTPATTTAPTTAAMTPATPAVSTTTIAATVTVPVPTTPVSTQALTETPKAVKTALLKKALSKEEEYLLSIDKKYYTLQLVGARNEKSVQQFIQKHQLEEHAYSYQTKLSGKDWYVVVLGEYATMDEAKAAAAALPNHIAAKPWIREFNSIHSDIKKQS